MDTPANHEDKAFEAEYSRLIHAVGKETLIKMNQYKILLIGLGGLGVEIAKNLVLTGIKSLTLCDDAPVRPVDLSSNFYLKEEDIGKPRAAASLPSLKRLNERVTLTLHSGEITPNDVKQFNVIVLTNNSSRKKLIEINRLCREHQVGFILADTRGLFGSVFVDHGHFVSYDVNGNRPIDRLVELITNETNATVHVISGEQHDLNDGDVVRFSGVEGMTEINGKEAKVTVVSPFSFKIDIDTTNFTPYSDRGRISEIKQPKHFDFVSLEESWSNYQDSKSITMDFMKDMTIKQQLHLFYQALLEFQDSKGSLPRPYVEQDAQELIRIAGEINNAAAVKVEEIDNSLFSKLSFTASGDLSPMACVLGGVVAQEIMKHAGNKFTPLSQWLYFDSLECLGKTLPTIDDIKLTNTRYDGQIAVFGSSFVERLRQLRYFLIGSGAIGCEILKNWAMMGVGSLGNGQVFVTDMDTIEISNLNRQFLYTADDVTKHKSVTAANAIQRMNKDINIKPFTLKVAPETEDVFNNPFWQSLDGVQNALDNVPARLYVDGRCIFYKKSLLEPGTLGPKGNVQVVVPGLTESYGTTPDPPQKETPICLLHAFPNNIEHCLQWAREFLFEGYFTKDPEITNDFLNQENYLSTVSPNLLRSALETIEKTVLTPCKSFRECIEWAHSSFEKHFFEAPSQILFSFPADYVDDQGHKFWSGAKRPPTPVHFDANNETHVDFVMSAAFLRAYVHGLINSESKPADFEKSREEIRQIAGSLKLKDFVPKVGVKIQTDPNAKDVPPETSDDDDQYVSSLQGKLNSMPPQARASFKRLNVVEFEKDDDRNWHIDFIHAAANLRATGYQIEPVDRLQCKLIAGRIIPAMITTTALVSGLSSLELYKLVQRPHFPLDSYRDTFVNLAINIYAQSDPKAPPKLKYKDTEFTLWDRIEVRQGDLTLQQLIDWLETNEGIEVDMIGIGNSLIYFSWMSREKRKERMGQKNECDCGRSDKETPQIRCPCGNCDRDA